ncbi:sensor histidine kinase [Tenggerimyces flavus]|uniref:histidine kinase n=1 Tax=Tenggerimyces flavus TaxID=1708749 RepID=A0ABV7YM24_9ACTN|nr:sensor histidine kinase [Tenggerimyces flavus]
MLRRTGREWLVDVVLALVVLTVAEISIAAGSEVGSIPQNAGAYLLGVSMAVPVLVLRRRRPLAELYVVAVALLAYYVIGYPGFPPAVVLAVPLYDAAHAGRLWRAVPVPVLLLGVGMVVAWRKGTALLDVVDVFLPQLGLVAVALLLGALVLSRHAYAAEAQQRLRAVEAARDRDAERRVVDERLRIARELHDTVAHAISTMTVQSGTALYTMNDQPAKAREALTAIRQTGKDALAEMRATLRVLRANGEPSVTAERDAGLERLPDLLTAVRAAGLDVVVEGNLDRSPAGGTGASLPALVDHAAYRIVRESLTNVLRHAGTQARARVRLELGKGALEVEVSDDGIGPTQPPGDGHGLEGMGERAHALGGHFEAGPIGDGGFRVRARIPIGIGDSA